MQYFICVAARRGFSRHGGDCMRCVPALCRISYRMYGELFTANEGVHVACICGVYRSYLNVRLTSSKLKRSGRDPRTCTVWEHDVCVRSERNAVVSKTTGSMPVYILILFYIYYNSIREHILFTLCWLVTRLAEEGDSHHDIVNYFKKKIFGLSWFRNNSIRQYDVHRLTKRTIHV